MKNSNETPISDEALDKVWPEFAGRVFERMLRGKVDYGDGSFLAPLAPTCEEIAQEFLDVAGWAFIGYCKVKRLQRVIEQYQPEEKPHA